MKSLHMLFKKYIFEFMWIFITLLIILTASIAQMYSRALTLDKVTKNQFKVMYILLNEYDEINKNQLNNILSPLIGKTGYAKFQVAILSEDEKKCFEDTKHFYNRPLLCPMIKNVANIIKQLPSSFQVNKVVELPSYYFSKDETKSQSYLFQKFTNSNEWLVAKTNFYSNASETEKFLYFLTHRYVGANGYAKIYDKGKFLTAVIIFFSLVLYILFYWYRKKQNERYFKITKKLSQIQNKWEQLNKKYHQLITEKNNIENEITRNEEELKNNLELIESEKNDLAAKIKVLKKQNSDISEKLKVQIESIRRVEKEEYELKVKKIEKIENLNCGIAKVEYEKTLQELNRIQQLWKHDPSWQDRKNIETKISEKETRLPFTITQGFVAFEDKIVELAFKYDPYSARQKQELQNYISIVCREKQYKTKRGSFDKIRLARNAWFHKAEYPDIFIINELISFLEKNKIKPLI